MPDSNADTIKQRLDDYDEMARFRWSQRMPGKPYPGGPLAAYDTMLMDVVQSRSTANADAPLAINVEDGKLVISIGISTLTFAFETSEQNNPFNDTLNDFETTYRVTNELQFANEVRRALCDEQEDGSTILTDLLDKAYWNAIDDGCEGVEEIHETP